MKLFKFLVLAVLLGAGLELRAQATTNYVAAILTFTNQTVTGNAIRLNGQTRYFTNLTGPLTILTNGTAAGSATNVFNAYAGNRLPAPVPYLSQTSSVVLTFYGAGLTCSLTGNFGSLVLITNVTGTNEWNVRYPFDALPPESRTNNASEEVYGLKYSSNAIPTGIKAMENFPDKTSAQTIGNKGITNAAISASTLSNVTPTYLVGGYWLNGILNSAIASNFVNYGSAISSPGSGDFSEQFGSGADASGLNDLAVGPFAGAHGTNSTAVGAGATVTSSGLNGTAVGTVAEVQVEGGTALGNGALVTSTATNGTAVGASAASLHKNSTTIGFNSQTTRENQIMLGTSTIDAYVNNVLEVGGSISNAVHTGTNVFRGSIAYTPGTVTTLVNGNNPGIELGTNVLVLLSGATTYCELAGFVAKEAGRIYEVEISGAATNYIINYQGSSRGTDGVASQRIEIGTGGDLVLTNNPASFRMYYNTVVSRWRILGKPSN